MDDVEALDFYIDAAEDAHEEGIEGVFQALVTPGIEGLLEIIDVQPDAESFHTNPSIWHSKNSMIYMLGINVSKGF